MYHKCFIRLHIYGSHTLLLCRYDFAFVDAEKKKYFEYFELLMKLVILKSFFFMFDPYLHYKWFCVSLRYYVLVYARYSDLCILA